MNFADIAHIAANYGASGLIVAWFAWRDWRRDIRDEKRREREELLMEKRISADIAMANGMAVLATKLDGLSNVRGN